MYTKNLCLLFSFVHTAKPAPLKNCTLRPYTSTATTTLLVSNLTTIYGYHNVKELNNINSNNAGSHHYGSTPDHLSDMVGDAASVPVPIVKQNSYNPNGGGRKMVSPSSSSLEMQFNLMEQDNNNSGDDKKMIVNKREVCNDKEDNNRNSGDSSENNHHGDISDESTIVYRSNSVYNSDNNNNENLSERMKTVMYRDYNNPQPNTTNNENSEKITTNQIRIVNRIIRNEVPLKYNNDNFNNNNNNVNKNKNGDGGGSVYAAALSTQHLNQHYYHDPFDTASTTYETRQSSSTTTMELECIAGYDGGLPQHFILEAYDSRTRKLRLNVTNAYTDVPLFRFDLSGKLIK